MKTMITYLIFTVMLVSCGQSYQERQLERAKKENPEHMFFPVNIFMMSDGEYIITEVDSCEWITGWVGAGNGGPVFTHRPRCKYCKERAQHEVK